MWDINEEGKILASWAFIDKTGKILFKAKGFYVDDFEEGLAAIWLESVDGKKGFIDKNGSMVIKPQYDDLSR